MLRSLGLLDANQLAFISFARRHSISFGTAIRLPLPDGSVEVLYSSHMLEHLDRMDADGFLNEAKRVLQPGGILRLVVPDLALLVKEYQADGDADRFMDRAHLCVPSPRTIREKASSMLSGPRHHQWLYDGRSLSKLLDQHGFVDIRVLQPGVTRISDPGALNLNERQSESLFVEAARP
jgi:predicted SAM-dependent methyltransferase